MTKLLKDIHRHTLCRSLMSVAAYSVLLFTAISCAQDMPSTPQQEQIPISMSASCVESMESSRALITDVSGLQEVGFGVYGYKQIPSGTQTLIFNDTKLEYTDGIWVYSPKRYWDRTAHYYFGAYAPTNLSNDITVTHNNTDGKHRLSFILPHWQVATSGTDLVTATSKGHATTYLSNESGVNLTFTHTLGYLEIQLIKGANIPDEYTYTLKNLTYQNVPSATPSATYILNYTDGTPELKTNTANSEYMVCNTATVIGKTSTNFSHLVVPFTTSKKITLSLTYTTTNEENSFEYTREINTQLTTIEAGKKYKLNLTFIGGAVINPEISITEWNKVTLDDNPVYNW